MELTHARSSCAHLIRAQQGYDDMMMELRDTQREYMNWIIQYCIKNNITDGNATIEHQKEIIDKASEFCKPKIDMCSFTSGSIAMIAISMPIEILENMLNEM